MGTKFRSFLLMLLVCPALTVQGQQIAAKKCSEYRKLTVKDTAIIPLTLNPKPIKYQNFNCSKTVDLIVGGEAAKPKEFPHQALLGWPDVDKPQEYDFRCGGSLISEYFVLTAAHCFKESYPVVVRLGEYNLDNEYDDQVDVPIDDFVIHPNYVPFSAYHDIALIKLKSKVPFTAIIRPACLWSGLNLNVTSVIATGFGHTENVGIGSPILRKVSLDLLDTQECVDQFKGSRKFKRGIIDEQICIGSKLGGMDTCQGDSGGPVQLITEPKGCLYHVVGVTSTGSACGVGRSPAVYSRVASYIDWIEKVVWK